MNSTMLSQRNRLELLSLLLVSAVVTNGYIVEPGPKVIATTGEVWPKPQEQEKGAGYYTVNRNFQFRAAGEDCKLLQKAFSRYEAIISNFVHSASEAYGQQEDWTVEREINFNGALDGLDVAVGESCDSEVLPTESMDESYALRVASPNSSDKSVLTASSVWGAMRGLESFSQLLYRSDRDVILNATNISDSPRFSHRGLLLDTSRHYIPVREILLTLDAMAYNKLNVFHWHIVDDQSFPYQSPKFPELSEKGAYHPRTKIYTPSDVQNIIHYAGERAIRVVAEFDTPGHTRSWGEGIPDILTPCYKNGKPTGQFGPLDPTKDFTYSFLADLFEEVTDTFPDRYFHLGGDEVGFECWESNPDIRQFMQRNNITKFAKLEDYYIKKVIDIVDGLKAKSIVWEEVFLNGVEIPKSTVVHVWTSNFQPTMRKVTEAGYPALLSSCWYLDSLATGGDWEKFYKCEPYNFPGIDDQKKLVMGGEACMWGETVNEYNVITRVWPRASAVAEKLWSVKDSDTEQNAAKRLEEHTCRMNRRGIHAQPPNGPGVCL